MIITIDGPAASGKGTVALGLANHYGLPHLDSGLLYRAVGHALIRELASPNLTQKAEGLAKQLDPAKLDAAVLGSQEVAFAAAKVARIPKVRAALFQVQRDFATQTGGAVLDGRDMGSRICPEAEVKLFINAKPEIRARRRARQLGTQGIKVSQDEMLAQILARDESDRLNPAGAFYPATDAHLLDTDELDIEAALKAAIAIVDAAVASGLG